MLGFKLICSLLFEAARRSIEIEARRKAGYYIIQILRMKEGTGGRKFVSRKKFEEY